MPKIVDGTPVDAATTNAALLGRTADDTASGKISLGNSDPASGSSITNIQRELNADASFMGKSTNVAQNTTPSYGNNNGFTPGENLRTRLDAVSGKFDATSGHGHSGTAGDGPQIDALSIGSVVLKGIGIQGTTLTSAGGTSTNVSTQLTGKTPSISETIRGVVVNTPYNKVLLRDTNDDLIKNGTGDTIYGRLTESSGVWTLSYYYLNGTSETSYSLPSMDVKWYYQELVNPIADAGSSYVYSPAFFIPSDNATVDVVDASATQRGLVNTSSQSFAGEKTFNTGVKVDTSFKLLEAVDSSSTGSSQSVALTKPTVVFTDSGLDSINNISSPADGKYGILINKTGGVLTIENDTGGTAANRIRTGTGTNLDVEDGAAITVVYDNNSSRWQVVGGSGSGNGTSLNKYLPLGDAETTNPFVMYADGSATPVDGTGGSPSATVTQTTSSPLAGMKSFLFNSGSLGDGAAYSFTIDSQDKSTIQTLIFSTDGALAEGDLTLWIYDVTNSVLIAPQPNGTVVESSSKQQFIFQLGTGTSYRFLIHQATGNSFTAKFEVSLIEMPFAGYGPVTKDPISYTPTFVGLGTGGTAPTNVDVKYDQDGKFINIQGTITTGTVTATPGGFSLPSGYQMDVSQSVLLVGDMDHEANTNETLDMHVIAIPGTSTTNLYFTRRFGPNNDTPLALQNATAILPSNAKMSFSARVPILGLTSESRVISEYDGRVVKCRYELSANTATTAGNPIIYDTKKFDTHGAFNNATGEFTAPVTGYYKTEVVSTSTAGTGTGLSLYKNGVYDQVIGDSSNATGFQAAAGNIYLAAGDKGTIVPASNTTSAIGAHVTWTLDSGAQQILAGQRILAEYAKGSNQGVTADVTKISFTTLINDTTGSWATDTFTAKATGDYMVCFTFYPSATSTPYLSITGSYTLKKSFATATGPGGVGINSTTTIVHLVAGDTMSFYSDSSVTFNGGTVGSGQYASHIAIKQVN